MNPFKLLHNPKLTTTLYTHLLKSHTLLTPFQSSTLITHLSHHNHLPLAHHLLRLTRNPDTAVFNSLISAHAHHHFPKPAFHLFQQLQHLNLSPDQFTLTSLIKCCTYLPTSSKLNTSCCYFKVRGCFSSTIMMDMLNTFVVKLGFGSNVLVRTALIDGYFKRGCVDSASKCINESCGMCVEFDCRFWSINKRGCVASASKCINESCGMCVEFDCRFWSVNKRGCVASASKCINESCGVCVELDGRFWSVVINGFVKSGEFGKGKEWFVKMRGLGFECDEFSLSGVMGCVSDGGECGVVHGLCVKRGFSSLYLDNGLMVMYGRCGCGGDARKVFDEMPEWDVVSWAGRIGVAFDLLDAFHVFKCCVSSGCEVNEYTLVNVLCHVDGGEIYGKMIHAMVVKDGYLSVTCVCNALVSMYVRGGQMRDARQVFDETPCPDSVSWSSITNGYLSNVKSMKCVTQVHSLVVKLGFMFTDTITSRLISGYGKCNGIESSKRLFSEIGAVDVEHVNAMAGAYDYCGRYTDVQILFHERWNASLDVNTTTFNIALKSCAALSDLHIGKSLHSLAIRTAISTDKFIESALIDVYSKCGCIEDAENIFWNITNNNNLVAWNTMITGYAQFGCYSKCYSLLTKLPEFGMRPDEITYLGILGACSHAGLVDEARYHLTSMFSLHGVIPCLEHYACVVDVLGKAGRVHEAKKTIDEMPMLPDARIWQILLSACNIYGIVDIGTVAARRLAELQPGNESSFVLLSNMYASAGMWSDVRLLRREMKNKTVSKEPGSSWIQVKEQVHCFFAGDSSHPRNEEIYMELHDLMNQMVQFPKEQDLFSSDGLLA